MENVLITDIKNEFIAEGYKVTRSLDDEVKERLSQKKAGIITFMENIIGKPKFTLKHIPPWATESGDEPTTTLMEIDRGDTEPDPLDELRMINSELSNLTKHYFWISGLGNWNSPNIIAIAFLYFLLQIN